MAVCRHVLDERHRHEQEQPDPRRRAAAWLHNDPGSAGQLSAARVAIPPIAPEAFHRRNPGARITSVGGATMGTAWSAQIVAPPSDIQRRLEAVLAGVVASMSQWEPSSALSRFNTAPVGEWHTLPSDLSRVLDAALGVHAATGGAFDPAQGALSELWGFGAAGPRFDTPADAAVAAAVASAGAEHIARVGDRTRRTAPVLLDLSGIAKGFAVDAMAACLDGTGVTDFVVEIGGEWLGRGIRPDGQPWWIDLEDPPGITLAPLRVALHNCAVATSGDYRRFIPEGPHRLGHTLDPRSGRPIANGVVSVSVIAADCMAADAWATALTVLGPDVGLAVATRERLAARIVTREGREVVTPALEAMLDG